MQYKNFAFLMVFACLPMSLMAADPARGQAQTGEEERKELAPQNNKRKISGVVKCENGGDTMVPCVGAAVTCNDTSTIGEAADIEGRFDLTCPNGEGITVSFLGCEDMRMSASELEQKRDSLVIELKTSPVAIEAVKVSTCREADLKKMNATYGTEVDGKCVPNACVDGYKLEGEKCVAKGGNESSTSQQPDGAASVSADSTAEEPASASGANKTSDAEQVKKPHSKEKLEELQDKVDAAKAKEQSFANRMLGGATMAATGAGGQMLASALSEQKADEQAEQDMSAYLATFRCNYGPHSVQGGEQNVQIPGGNELIGLYAQYVNLANDLKVRKNALGMRAGIESEPILDNATSGLYDDVGTGITSGAYASLARALMNPDGADAAKWAAQKEDTQKQLKTGAITAGVGAAAGLVGNLIINSDKAVEERNAKRHCADAGGTWNEKTKKCTGADCGADMKWDDDKNSCVHVENLGAGTASVASAKSGADNSVEAKSST